MINSASEVDVSADQKLASLLNAASFPALSSSKFPLILRVILCPDFFCSAEVRWKCEPHRLNLNSTNEVTAAKSVIGQERAIKVRYYSNKFSVSNLDAN